MARDRESIGLTADNQRVLEEIMARGWFSQGQDAARFCMAYAIRNEVAPGATDATETRWAAGNFDKSGELKAVILALYPETDTPVRLMEHFVNQGMALVEQRLKAGEVNPSDLLPIEDQQEDDEVVVPDVVVIPLDDERVAREKYKRLLPVYSLRAAAGYFGRGEAVEPEGWVDASEVGRLDGQMFVARAVGRSMEPRIHDGDFIVFRADPVGTRQGKIVLAEYQGPADPDTDASYAVRKYSSEKTPHEDGEWRHTRVVLSPVNSDYAPIELRPKDKDDFRILAEFIAVLESARHGEDDE